MEVFVDKEQKKKELDSYGVHDLRHMARNLGVARPTMKIKEQLIDEIAEILVGNVSASQASGKGRNPTQKLAQFSTADLVLPPVLQALIKARETTTFQSSLNSAVLSQSVREKLVFSNQREGFLEQEQDEYYFWDLITEKLVYVNRDIVAGNELKVGDRVSARCVESPAVTFSVAEEVLSINFDTKFLPRAFCSFKNDIAKISQTAFSFGDVKEGEALVLSDKLEGKVLESFQKVFKSFSNSGFKVVLSGTSVKQDVFLKVSKNLACEDALFYLGNAKNNAVIRIKNVLQNAVLRAACGEKILLVLVDVKQILADVEYCLQSESKHELITFDSVRFLSYITNYKRVLTNGGSLTIVAFNA